MPISDLTGTKWLINDTFSTMPSGYPMDGDTGNNEICYINFISNSNTYSYITWGDGDTTPYEYDGVVNYCTQNSQTLVWGGSWKDQAYRTIEITGGTDATNGNLIAWLQANATQQIDPEPEEAVKNSSFNSIAFNNDTKVLTVNDKSYLLATGRGPSCSGDSFSQVSLTNAGALSIGDNIINLLADYNIQGYSGSVIGTNIPSGGMGSGTVYLKFDSAPSSSSDYDVSLTPGANQSSSQTLTIFSNKTKVYIWANYMDAPAVTYNGSTFALSHTTTNNGLTMESVYTWDGPYELTLTGNYDITLHVAYAGVGTGGSTN